MTVSTFILAIIAGVTPSLIWLWFWLHEDKTNPEPKSLIETTFISGILAVIAAVFAEKYISEIVSDISIRYTLWAAVEEIFKFVAVAVIALKSTENDEPIDAMIYCIVVALGFAAVENTLFIMGPFSSGEIASGIVTGNMRFIGATLVHIVCSATVGFAMGYVFYRGYLAKCIALILGLSSAIALHAAFNISIINSGSANTLQTFAWVWGAVVILIVLFEEIKAVRQKQIIRIK
ncbi:MAG: PrsW family glutamic-type intramembrane protease [Candidatus Paceibacterota bacterium]|jgi:RsiW-degrading membrane proteinase PrsW (M82 family)